MHLPRASGSGPAALVLAGQVVKIKFHLYKKQVIKNFVWILNLLVFIKL